MAASKSQKIQTEIDKVKTKISEQQKAFRSGYDIDISATRS